MSTIYNFNEECPAGTAALQPLDKVLVWENASGRTKYLTGDLVAGTGAGVVNTTATTLTLTQAAHGNRMVTVSSAAAIAITLPQATGTGTKYKFQVQVAATATQHTIKVANSTDVMQGIAWVLSTTSANVIGFATSATSDTITLDGTTTGGKAGDIIEIEDVKTGFFSVKAFTSVTTAAATPFSAAVP